MIYTTLPDTKTFTRYVHTNDTLELRRKIQERLALSKTTKEQLGQLIHRLDNLIIGVSNASQSTATIERRTILEQEIFKCQREILQESLECWRDVTKLQQELQTKNTQKEMLEQ